MSRYSNQAACPLTGTVGAGEIPAHRLDGADVSRFWRPGARWPGGWRDGPQSWGLRGYAIPVLFPQVGNLPWEDIAKLRRDRNVARFRALLRQVEHEATEEAASGDIEAAAHHAYERHLADERVEGLGSVAKGTVGGLIIGGATGIGTAGIAPPWGLAASTLIPTGVGTVLDLRRVIRRRRARGWLSVVNRINSLRDAGS